MATGDQNDIQNRLTALTPNGWFPNGASPILSALYAGCGNAIAAIYSLLAYVRNQTRIATATDGFLDLISQDFFGPNLPRGANQSDASYRAAIQLALFPQKATRAAVSNILQQLTGRTPIIIEPFSPGDCGAYGSLANPNVPCGYNVAGRYGDLQIPYQAFVIAYRPAGAETLPNIAGYNISTGAYSTPSQSDYVAASTALLNVSDAAIYAAVNNVRPVDSTIWVRISN
ncbi:MAG: hypothetical protein KGL39_41720 [Patescibacteria group bacterium]|nr:hypothetical protein [Patescibacteria group bacterium]